ncbi:MAG: ubiquinol-cytochrome c reductase iron-sulfur subunit [Chitinophagaceae bacterium]
MDRKEFLSQLGLTSATFLLVPCLGGCTKSSVEGSGGTPPPDKIDFTIDLSNPENSILNSTGGYLIKNGIIVAKTVAGNYVAVSAACTHEGNPVEYQSNNDQFYCPRHGATFSTSGAVTGGPARSNLKQYNTTLSGTSLRVYA